MKFEITQKAKKQCKKNRIKTEKKWTILRRLEVLAFLITMLCFVFGILFAVKRMDTQAGICAAFFSVFLVTGISIRALLANFTSHWVDDRLNERMWTEGDTLYHFIQTSFAAGANIHRADERGYLFAIDISSIREAKYDEKSKRIEFLADGTGYHYADVDRDVIDKEWPLKGFQGIFYDYMNPSLYETLKGKGISFRVQTLDFKLRDAGI